MDRYVVKQTNSVAELTAWLNEMSEKGYMLVNVQPFVASQGTLYLAVMEMEDDILPEDPEGE